MKRALSYFIARVFFLTGQTIVLHMLYSILRNNIGGKIMFGVAVVIVVAIIAACLDSILGKIVLGATIVALGLLLLSWISGMSFLIVLAKVCAAVVVIVVVGAILLAIIG